ncbi:MAG: YicC family protein [Acidobacteria bacterium]|nr:YicC family protein [Acidobacteriota bacterium]
MVNSMTGFGRASATVGGRFHVTVTAKSVNHRYLEVSVRLPEFLWELESHVRAIASEAMSRGKIDISVRAQRVKDPEWTVRVDQQIARALVPKLNEVVSEFGLHRMTAGDLLRVPDFIQVEANDAELEDVEKEQFAAVVRAALDSLRAMRAKEGESLRDDMATRIRAMRERREALLGRRDGLVAELLDLYRTRVQEIAAQAGLEIPADRLAVETVMMVEKGDVAEELSRMLSHFDQFDAALAGKEPSGKRLDFLCQEILREINTLGSKSKSSELRNAVVELKAEIERIREQVQNVE